MLTTELLAKGEELRRFRLDAGLSQSDLAVDALTSQRCISDAENQRRKTETATLIRISQVLNVQLRQIAHIVTIGLDRENDVYLSSLDVLRTLLKQSDEKTDDCQALIESRIARDPNLARYRELPDDDKSSVWNLLESDMWVACQTDGRLRMVMPPCHFGVTCLPQIEFTLSETHLKLASYDEYTVEEQQLLDEMGFNLPEILQKLGKRLLYLEQVVSDRSSESIPDAVVSCDLALVHGNSVLARVVFELCQGISRLVNYFAVKADDEQFVERMHILHRFLFASRFDVLWMYDQINQGENSGIAVKWVQYRPYIHMAAISILVPPFDNDANNLQRLCSQSPLSSQFKEVLDEIINLTYQKGNNKQNGP